MPASAHDMVRLTFPEADARLMWDKMKRANRELNRSVGQSVRWGAWNLSKTLGTSTKEPTTDVVASRKARRVEPGDKKRRARGSNRPWTVTSWRQGKKQKWTVWAPRKADVYAMPIARIGNFGLARASWSWAISGLGSGARWGRMTTSAKRNAQRSVRMVMNLKSYDPYVRITNEVPHILHALTGGEAQLNGALGRAARMLEHQIDDKLKKKMGAK